MKKNRFSLLYLDHGEPMKDSARFRKRISAFFSDYFNTLEKTLHKEIKKELGVEVPYILHVGFSFKQFFENAELRDVLDAICLISAEVKCTFPASLKSWIVFVKRVFEEENLCYTIDDAGVVHYFIDKEFEKNRISLLKSLESPRYAGVRQAFEDAHKHLDVTPIDTKASVRSLFESIEILTRLMHSAKNLNKSFVKMELKAMAQKACGEDDIALKTVGTMFDGFGEWVDALHNYRHGQGKEEPVAPSLEFAVYVISSGASIIRWLIEIDKKN